MPLIHCLQDKTPSIRSAAEDVIVEVMQASSYRSFVESITDLKPAVKQTIKPILDKCRSRLPDQDEDMEEDEPMSKTMKAKEPIAKTEKPEKKDLSKSLRPNTAKPARPASKSGSKPKRVKPGAEEEKKMSIIGTGNK